MKRDGKIYRELGSVKGERECVRGVRAGDDGESMKSRENGVTKMKERQ